MKTKTQKGFTLVEVMIGIAAGAILLLAGGTALVGGQRFWSNALIKANLQRDASYAMLRISRSFKEGISAQLDDYGRILRIHRKAGWIEFYSPQGTNDLYCQIEGQDPQTIISGGVENVTYTLQNKLLRIDVWLKKDNSQIHYVSTVMMRNYGG